MLTGVHCASVQKKSEKSLCISSRHSRGEITSQQNQKHIALHINALTISWKKGGRTLQETKQHSRSPHSDPEQGAE